VTAGLVSDAEQRLNAEALSRREHVTSALALYAVVI